jgi:hypothetical protein
MKGSKLLIQFAGDLFFLISNDIEPLLMIVANQVILSGKKK